MATTKSTPKKTTPKKSAAKKTAAKKTAAKKTAAKKTVAKKTSAAKKTAAKKTSAAKKSVAKKAPKKPTRTSANSAKTSTSRPDAIAVLKADHQRVTDLFDKFEGLGDNAHKSREKTVAKIIEELSVHAGIEEEVFYPPVRERLAKSNESTVLEALEEHHVVKLTLNELQSMSSEHERYTAKVTVLRELVDHHVDEEETELFKLVRQEFSKSELTALGDALEAARPTAPTKPHPMAPDAPPGNIVSNVLAAPLDVTSKAARVVREAIS